MSIWMIFTPRSATSTSHDAYVGGSQSLRYAKTLIVKVCIPSSHPYLALVLISTAQCITGLRSKRLSANPGAITATLAANVSRIVARPALASACNKQKHQQRPSIAWTHAPKNDRPFWETKKLRCPYLDNYCVLGSNTEISKSDSNMVWRPELKSDDFFVSIPNGYRCIEF